MTKYDCVMRGVSRSQALWIAAGLVIVVALAVFLYDPVMNAIFTDRHGMDELSPP